MSEDVLGPKNGNAAQADTGSPENEQPGHQNETDCVETPEDDADEYRSAEQVVAEEIEAMADSLVDSAFTLALEGGATRWFNFLPRNGRGAIALNDESFDDCGVETALKVFRLSIVLRDAAEQLEEPAPVETDTEGGGDRAN